MYKQNRRTKLAMFLRLLRSSTPRKKRAANETKKSSFEDGSRSRGKMLMMLALMMRR